MRGLLLHRAATMAAAVLAISVTPAAAQIGGGAGGPGGFGRPNGGAPANYDGPPAESTEKPEAAAKKFFTAGMKSLNKARDQETAAAHAPNDDKKNAALEKMNEYYGKALDQFTEALSNKGDMVAAWTNVGYIHLRLGAYAESVDDYNHTLALQSDLEEAIEHRGEAYLGVDRLDDARSAYMDLFNHDRPLADQLMAAMQQWLAAHRADPRGMRAGDIDAFGKWLQERDGIAKQAASLPQ